MMKYKFLQLTILLFLYSSVLIAQSNFDLAVVLFDNQRYGEAKELFEKELNQNNSANVHHYLGRTYLAIGNHDKAIKHGKYAVKLDAYVSEYHLLLAQAIGTKALNSNIFTKTRLSGKIRNEFEKTVELDSTNIQGRTGLINYYLRTPSFLGGDIKKAIEHAKFLKNQNEFRGRLALASIYQVQDKVDSAFVQFEHLENQYGDSPDHYYFYNNYGYFLLEQKQYDKAIEKFKKQIMLAPLQSNPYDSLGDAYEATGNLPEAIKAYQKALEIEPDIEITRKKLKDLERQSRR